VMTLAPDVLSGVALFRGLTREQLSDLATLLKRRDYAAGVPVITADEPGETIYIVLAGSVKVHVEHPDGTGVVLAILGPGEVVGEMSLADSLGRSASVTTLEETSFLWVDRATFRRSVRETPTLALNLANVLSRRLRLTNIHLRSLATLDVPGRVAAQLVAFAQEYGEDAPGGGVRVPMRLTQADLAGLVGASRVRVNQTLGYFRRQNFISVAEDNRFIVLDQDALIRRAR
jgi:CRP/FNR family transcriptional regulator, cyclic AMP receptor protein